MVKDRVHGTGTEEYYDEFNVLVLSSAQVLVIECSMMMMKLTPCCATFFGCAMSLACHD
jgi:hypothetical protein